jgi:hypothetical protein
LGLVQDQHSDGANTDVLADRSEMLVHGLDADFRHDNRGTNLALRADSPAQIRRLKTAIAHGAWSGSAFRPDPRQCALLTDPGFIAKPDLHRLARRLGRQGCGDKSRELGLKSRLRLRVALRMLRTHRQAPERQLVQQLADRALVQRDAKVLLDPLLEIDAPPAHHAVALQIGAFLHPGLNRGLLLRRQARQRAVAPRLVGQAIQAAGIVAMHPVAQRLAIHRAGLCRLRARAPLQHQRDRQHPARHFGLRRPRRCLPQIGG